MENRKKRGRPKSDNSRNRERKVKFNYDEDYKIEELLHLTGQNFSAYIRDLIRKDWYDKMV